MPLQMITLFASHARTMCLEAGCVTRAFTLITRRGYSDGTVAVGWIGEVHAHVVVSGKVGTLQHHIMHYGMPHISKQLRNLDRYTRYEADEMYKQGTHFHWYRLIIHPWEVFFYRYLWLRGFNDGWRGFIVCSYLAIYDFLSQAKLWEIEEIGIERSSVTRTIAPSQNSKPALPASNRRVESNSNVSLSS